MGFVSENRQNRGKSPGKKAKRNKNWCGKPMAGIENMDPISWSYLRGMDQGVRMLGSDYIHLFIFNFIREVFYGQAISG